MLVGDEAFPGLLSELLWELEGEFVKVRIFICTRSHLIDDNNIMREVFFIILLCLPLP